MQLSDQLQIPAALAPGKELGASIEQKVCWEPEPAKRKTVGPVLIRPRNVGCSARSLAIKQTTVEPDIRIMDYKFETVYGSVYVGSLVKENQ